MNRTHLELFRPKRGLPEILHQKQFSGDAAKWLVEEISKRGVTAKQSLAGTGLTDAWLKDPQATLTDDQYQKLVLNALDQTGDPALGLNLPQQSNYISRFDYWGYAILSSANWGQACRVAMEYWEVPGALVRLGFCNEEKTCCWRIYPALEPKNRRILTFAVEKFLSASLATITFAAGSPPPILEVHLSYPAPDHAPLYRELTAAPVRFDQEENLVRMDPEILRTPLLLANPQIVEVCLRQCHELMSNLRKSGPTVGLIRRLIAGSPGNFPSAEQAARKLGMSTRTLRRRLSNSDTSYSKVLKEMKAELAMGYLTSTRLSIDEIAGLLGYAETTSFRRSFKKWVGRSASTVRKEAGQNNG